MQLPRKGIIIRLLIYGPLLGYFGWHAWQKWRGDVPAPAPEPESVDQKLAPHKKVIELPDGSKQEIYELTPEQAEEILGRPLPSTEPANDAGKAPTEPPEDPPTEAKAEPPSEPTETDVN